MRRPRYALAVLLMLMGSLMTTMLHSASGYLVKVNPSSLDAEKKLEEAAQDQLDTTQISEGRDDWAESDNWKEVVQTGEAAVRFYHWTVAQAADLGEFARWPLDFKAGANNEPATQAQVAEAEPSILADVEQQESSSLAEGNRLARSEVTRQELQPLPIEMIWFDRQANQFKTETILLQLPAQEGAEIAEAGEETLLEDPSLAEVVSLVDQSEDDQTAPTTQAEDGAASVAMMGPQQGGALSGDLSVEPLPEAARWQMRGQQYHRRYDDLALELAPIDDQLLATMLNMAEGYAAGIDYAQTRACELERVGPCSLVAAPWAVNDLLLPTLTELLASGREPLQEEGDASQRLRARIELVREGWASLDFQTYGEEALQWLAAQANSAESVPTAHSTDAISDRQLSEANEGSSDPLLEEVQVLEEAQEEEEASTITQQQRQTLLSLSEGLAQLSKTLEKLSEAVGEYAQQPTKRVAIENRQKPPFIR